MLYSVSHRNVTGMYSDTLGSKNTKYLDVYSGSTVQNLSDRVLTVLFVCRIASLSGELAGADHDLFPAKVSVAVSGEITEMRSTDACGLTDNSSRYNL
jgi:hypothetical protein